jgi:D-glycero-D-manno-heptose 1,7-bisphosphate phosphatase
LVFTCNYERGNAAYICEMAEKKAVFLDKDGTLIPDVPYNVNPEFITLAEGVVEGLQLLKSAGYIFIVISNQAGVARGYFEMEDLELVKQKLDILLRPSGIEIAQYYFCPHHPEGKLPPYAIACDCRKPKPGMILQALKDLDISAEQSWMVGDILNDAEAGNRAGCRSVLIDTGNETEWVQGPFRTPDYVGTDFLTAARFIFDHPFETLPVNDNELAVL